MLNEEIAYNAFMDAVNYRIQKVSEQLRIKSLPAEFQAEYEAKLAYLLKLQKMMF